LFEVNKIILSLPKERVIITSKARLILTSHTLKVRINIKKKMLSWELFLNEIVIIRIRSIISDSISNKDINRW